jgi:hypothetical protein
MSEQNKQEIEQLDKWAVSNYGTRHFPTYGAMKAAWLARAQLAAPADELRKAVRAITGMLNDREWAEHVSREPDAAELESAITEMHNDLSEAHGRITELEAQLAAAPVAAQEPTDYKLVPIAATNEIVCAIEREIDNQLAASGMSGVMHRQDGQHVWDAAIAAAPAPPETWKVLPSQAKSADHKQFAIVLDRDFSDGLSLAVYDGSTYMFSDGDCFNRDGDTLDGYTAEFLTQYELEQRLSAAAAKPFIPRTPEEMIAFIGSQYGSMRFATEDGIELPKEDVSYSLTVHDLLSAFSMAGFYDVDAEPTPDAAAIVAAAKAIDTPHGPITLIHTRDDGAEVPTLMAEQFVRALIGGSK